MLDLLGGSARLCDGVNRREMLRIGGLGALGLSASDLLGTRAAASMTPGSTQDASFGRAQSCIILFLLGGPPQHSTWDPKPDAPAEVRGEFKPIATAVPGIQISELLPRTARMQDKICVLRAVSSNDNAHSSSGYYMMTGQPHKPMNFENANPGPPNDAPCIGAIYRQLRRGQTGLPAAVTLPHRIWNTDGSVWPGQDAGFLGRAMDPWLLKCNPGSPSFQIDDVTLAADVSAGRLGERQSLLDRIGRSLDRADRAGVLRSFGRQELQAFELLRSPQAQRAFRLDQEPGPMRDRYGRSPFGQSVLLARRLIEAQVPLVQVNWFRSPDEPSDAPCWDSHARETQRLKTVLVPPLDLAYSALLEDLSQRGLLEKTLVVVMAEFGRTPRFNRAGGRDHWGYVYSLAFAGGGIRGGQVVGASDKIGGMPRDGRVQPQDITATIFHCLGYRPDTEILDPQMRPLPISRGEVIRQVL